MNGKYLDELIAKFQAGETLEEVLMSAYARGWSDGSNDIFGTDDDEILDDEWYL